VIHLDSSTHSKIAQISDVPCMHYNCYHVASATDVCYWNCREISFLCTLVDVSTSRANCRKAHYPILEKKKGKERKKERKNRGRKIGIKEEIRKQRVHFSLGLQWLQVEQGMEEWSISPGATFEIQICNR